MEGREKYPEIAEEGKGVCVCPRHCDHGLGPCGGMPRRLQAADRKSTAPKKKLPGGLKSTISDENFRKTASNPLNFSKGIRERLA
jgi:hypothetical protein